MLREPTFEKLHRLRLRGMAEAFEQQLNQPDMASLSFEERFGLLVDAQWNWKENKAVASRLKKARLPLTTCFEDINFRHPRGLDRSLIRSLGDCQWLARHQNILITGPTGIGKSYLCQAFLHKACREGYSAYYSRASRFFRDLEVAHADGSLTVSCGLWPEPTCSALTIGDWLLSPISNAAIGWKCWMTATAAAPPCSPANTK
jgi:DNA replication protein DnaC